MKVLRFLGAIIFIVFTLWMIVGGLAHNIFIEPGFGFVESFADKAFWLLMCWGGAAMYAAAAIICITTPLFVRKDKYIIPLLVIGAIGFIVGIVYHFMLGSPL